MDDFLGGVYHSSPANRAPYLPSHLFTLFISSLSVEASLRRVVDTSIRAHGGSARPVVDVSVWTHCCGAMGTVVATQPGTTLHASAVEMELAVGHYHKCGSEEEK